MRKCLYMAGVLLSGIMTAQMIATLQVYLSNSSLYEKLIILREAGYLTVPNLMVMRDLKAFGPAFLGGLFFSLTVGAGLSVISFVLAWSWDRVLARDNVTRILFILLWLALVVFFNLECFSPLNSAYFIFVPAVVVLATLTWMPDRDEQKGWTGVWIHLVPFFLLFLLWGGLVDRNLYTNFRDNVLLSNPVGARINQFYYKYTLYPAEVIKGFEQKLLKSCRMEAFENKHMARSLQKALLRYNYLVVEGSKPVDLEVIQHEDAFIFRNHGKEVLRTPIKTFFSNPGESLSEFSRRCDCNRLFRNIIFLSLLIGQSIFVYILVRTVFCSIACLFFEYRISSVAASYLCLFVGILLLLPLFPGDEKALAEKEPARIIESGNTRERIAVLKLMIDRKMDIGSYPDYRKILQSSSVPERCLFARAMGVSRKPETYQDLLTLLDDPIPNVAYVAYQALGQRRDRKGIKEILSRMETSDHWYKQVYAYKALRTLGWNQKRSN